MTPNHLDKKIEVEEMEECPLTEGLKKHYNGMLERGKIEPFFHDYPDCCAYCGYYFSSREEFSKHPSHCAYIKQAFLSLMNEAVGEMEDIYQATLSPRKVGRPNRERKDKERLVKEKKAWSFDAQIRNQLRQQIRERLKEILK